MVSEIIPAILGPLPLPRQPKSRPFTPCAVVAYSLLHERSGQRPDSGHGRRL